MDTFLSKLKQFGRARANVILAKHTTFQIGGPARFFVEVNNGDEVAALLDFLRAKGIRYFLMGGGSNILFSDEGYDGVVVKLQTTKYQIQNTSIEADAGIQLSTLVEAAAKGGLTGLEWAAGIPGTVGGAVYGNAGAMGAEIARAVSEVEVWRDGEIWRPAKKDCGFAYRESAFKYDNSVILRVWLKLAVGDKKEIIHKIHEYLRQRLSRQATYPSAGSFFKNIKLADWPGDKSALPKQFLERGSVPVGYLIEEAGFSGVAVGEAKVSEKHGNFIVNFKNATQADVLALVEKIKEAVYNKYKVELKEEVIVVK